MLGRKRLLFTAHDLLRLAIGDESKHSIVHVPRCPFKVEELTKSGSSNFLLEEPKRDEPLGADAVGGIPDQEQSVSGFWPRLGANADVEVRVAPLLGEHLTCQGIECQGQFASMLRALPGVSNFSCEQEGGCIPRAIPPPSLGRQQARNRGGWVGLI